MAKEFASDRKIKSLVRLASPLGGTLPTFLLLVNFDNLNDRREIVKTQKLQLFTPPQIQLVLRDDYRDWQSCIVADMEWDSNRCDISIAGFAIPRSSE